MRTNDGLLDVVIKMTTVVRLIGRLIITRDIDPSPATYQDQVGADRSTYLTNLDKQLQAKYASHMKVIDQWKDALVKTKAMMPPNQPQKPALTVSCFHLS